MVANNFLANSDKDHKDLTWYITTLGACRTQAVKRKRYKLVELTGGLKCYMQYRPVVCAGSLFTWTGSLVGSKGLAACLTC